MPKASPFKLIDKEGNKAANNCISSFVSARADQSSKLINTLLYMIIKDNENTAITKLLYTKYMVASSFFPTFIIAIIDNPVFDS